MDGRSWFEFIIQSYFTRSDISLPSGYNQILFPEHGDDTNELFLLGKTTHFYNNLLIYRQH